MQVIQEFKTFGGKVKTVTKLDTTFSIWVSEVRELQKETGFDNLNNASMKDLHRFYDSAYLPQEVIQILTPSYSNTY
jgi:hypothetical protein